MMLNRVHSEARGAIWLTNRDQRICGVSSEQIAVSSGTGPWHPAWKLVKSLPVGSPSLDRDAGSNRWGHHIFSLLFFCREKEDGVWRLALT